MYRITLIRKNSNQIDSKTVERWANQFFWTNIDIFAAKMWGAFAMQKLLTFFQHNINGFAILLSY